MKFPRPFPKKEDVQTVTDAGGDTVRSNRGYFKAAAVLLVALWVLTFMFGLASIWVPTYVMAANFSGTAWLFGFIAFFGSIAWAVVANEFMDVV